MDFIPSNWEDITRYYRNTYIKVKETGDTLYYIQSVSPESVEGIQENGDGFKICLGEHKPFRIDYILPKKSVYQFGKDAHLLHRIPAKQYQRGLSEYNTKILRLLKDGSSKNVGVSFERLVAFVNKQAFSTFSEVLSNKAKNNSSALSSRFWYAHEAACIMCDFTIVASIHKLEKVVKMQNSLFKPEVVAIVKDIPSWRVV